MENENNVNKNTISSNGLEKETSETNENSVDKSKKRKIVYFSNYPISSNDYKEGVDAISKMVSDENVFNIGIIAPYGAGKSSLIKTYREGLDSIQNSKIVEVSLVHLSENKKSSKQTTKQSSDEDIKKQGPKQSDEEHLNNEEEELEEELEEETNTAENLPTKNKDALLEKSILEQLFFREKKTSLPSSRIERIHSRVTIAVWFSILVVFSFIFSLFTVLQFNNQLPLLDEKLSWQGAANAHNYNLGILFALSALHVAVTIFLLFLLLKNGKLKLKNIEIDFNKIESGSVLNFFLDEIIYYFEKTKINVVIFEDIERFGSVSLFTKLREINHILNNNKRIKHKITFIYCVTDDFFAKEEDRAKFFEFVLSLVPVMNSNNAGGHINGCLSKNGLELDDTFVKGISRFITDKRVLNDIINDFLYFRVSLQKLNGSNSYSKEKNSDEKLFAMMVYKNLFFNDYVKLLKNKGELFNLFSKYKNDFVKELNIEKKKELDKIEKEIKNVNERSFVTKRFEDLKNIVTGVLSNFGTTSTSAPNGFEDLASIKTFENVKTGVFVAIQSTIRNGYYQQTFSGVTYKSLTIDKIDEYLETPVIEIEKDLTGESLNELNQRKATLNKEIFEINQSTLQQLLSKNDVSSLSNEFLKNRVIYFILSNGYIDETYYLYIGQSDSLIDREFVNSVLCNIPSNPSTELKNCELTVLELASFGTREFQKKSIFNYSLVAFLFSDSINYPSERSAFLEFIQRNKDEETKQFVKEFVLSNYNSDEFFAQLCKKDDYAVFDLFKGNDVSEEDKTRVVKSLIKRSPNINLRPLNKDGVITRLVENHQKPLENFATLFGQMDSFLDFLEDIDLKKFKHLDYSDETNNNPVWKEAFSYLIDDLSFEINYDNLQTIELHYFDKSDVTLSVLLDKTNALTNYIEENLELVVKLISENNNSLYENPEIIKEILQNTKLSIEAKDIFVSSLADAVNYDSGFSLEVINSLLVNDKLTKKWSSIVDIFKKSNDEIKKSIIIFIHEGIDSFTDKLTDKDVFNYLLSSCGEHEIELLDKIAKMSLIKLSIDDIKSDQKCKMLVLNGIVDSNEENLLKCGDKIDSFIAMLTKNRELESVAGKVMFDLSGLIRVLQSSQVNPDCKNSILKANSKVFEGELSDVNNPAWFAAIDLIVDLIRITHRVCLGYNIMAVIANRLRKYHDKETFDFVVDSCLREYSSKELVFFIKEINNSIIYMLIPEDGGNTIQIDTALLDSNRYLKALLEKNIITIVRRGSVHTRVKVGNLLLLIIIEGSSGKGDNPEQ